MSTSHSSGFRRKRFGRLRYNRKRKAEAGIVTKDNLSQGPRSHAKLRELSPEESSRIWMVFKYSEEKGGWVAVDQFKQHLDIQRAVDQIKSLNGQVKRRDLRIIGFPSKQSVRLVVKEENLVEEGGAYIFRVENSAQVSTATTKPITIKRKVVIRSEPPSSMEDLINSIVDLHLRFQRDVAYLFSELGYKIADKRPKGGCLWVIGDDEILRKLVMRLNQRTPYQFRFAANGGKATRQLPSWYTRSA